MSPEEKEELKMLMSIEETFLPDRHGLLTYGSKPGLFRAFPDSFGGKPNPDYIPAIYPKEEFTHEDLVEWGLGDYYLVWGVPQYEEENLERITGTTDRNKP